MRIQYSNDKESVREKFILVIWIGPNCKVMRKAKVRILSPSSIPHLPCYVPTLLLPITLASGTADCWTV